MTEKDLFREIGMIDEKFVEEASVVKQNKIITPVFRRTLATVACLCICVGIYFSVQSVREGSKEKSANGIENLAEDMIMESATADSGAMEEYDSAEGTLNGIMDDIFADSTETEEKVEWDSQENSASVDGMAGGESIPMESETKEGDEFIFPQTARVVKELAGYSNDYEMLCDGDAFVVIHGSVSAGMDKWELFLDSIEQSEEVWVDVIRFTLEGDAIITRVWYENGSFCLVEDSTRDAWGNGAYAEFKFTCMNVMENSEGYVEIVFANQSIDELTEAISQEVPMYYLVQYKEEK